MEKGAEFNFAQKLFLVQRLACFDTPSEAARAFKEEFGFEPARSRVAYYDPTTKFGAALQPELKAVFEQTRRGFLEQLDAIPIANKAVRLRHLQRQLDYYAPKNAGGIVMELCEAAAKEMGGAFTNRRELSGPNGGPIETKSTAQQLTDAELEAIARGGSAGTDTPPQSAQQPG